MSDSKQQPALNEDLEKARIYFEGHELSGGSYVTLPSTTIRLVGDKEVAAGTVVEFGIKAFVKDVVFKNAGDDEKDAARVQVCKAVEAVVKVN